jgi:hypothetical protein
MMTQNEFLDGMDINSRKDISGSEFNYHILKI